MGWFLFIIVLVVSFIVVRIGAIAFQLTGLNWELAKFQALSCFTGTGFTTRESELIVGHRQRRKIASVLMVLGNAGLVLMIASFATSLNPLIMDTIDEPLLPLKISVKWIPVVNLMLIAVAVLIIYKVFTNKKVSDKFTNFLRRKIIKREVFRRATFEELLIATGGYGVSKIDVLTGSIFADKSLGEVRLRKDYDVTLLAITRGTDTIANPSADEKIKVGDELICFRKLEDIREKMCAQK
jgi:Trk-type K+ transport system membrane component